MKKLALVSLLLALPVPAFAINTSQLDHIPLPTVTPWEIHHDEKFETEFKKLPHALNFLKDILRSDVQNGRLSMRRKGH